jgi:hypothetical protein
MIVQFADFVHIVLFGLSQAVVANVSTSEMDIDAVSYDKTIDRYVIALC